MAGLISTSACHGISPLNANDQVKMVTDSLHTAMIQGKIPKEKGARIILLFIIKRNYS
jgi:hypothetical protein